MTITSIIVHLWRKQHANQIPTNQYLQRWCYETFGEVPSLNMANKIRETLETLAAKDNEG